MKQLTTKNKIIAGPIIMVVFAALLTYNWSWPLMILAIFFAGFYGHNYERWKIEYNREKFRKGTKSNPVV